MVQQLTSLKQLAGTVASARTLFTTGCAAEVLDLPSLLTETDCAAELSGIFIPGVNRCDYTSLNDSIHCQTFFMTPPLAQGQKSGRLHYSPWRYRDIIRHYQSAAVDVAVVMLSEPDSLGYCSYGVTSDYSPIVLPMAAFRVGVVNRQMPVLSGERVHLSELDAVIEIDQPLVEMKASASDEVSSRIAEYVSGFIDDGATIQLGLGSIPGAVAAAISDRNKLKVRSGLIDASIIGLEEAGALCVDTPVLGGVALGDAEFYAWLNNNPRFHFRRASVTHSVDQIAATKNFIAVNGALEVDLLGQVNSCVMPSGYISGPGGLPEFVAGALQSKGGRSIIALNATAKKGSVSRIVTKLQGDMPSVTMMDADVVVTEYGIAELRGKSLEHRAQAMIAIAAPSHRDALQAALGG